MATRDPYSIEMRYTLDLVLYALQVTGPRSVRISSRSIEVSKAVLRCASLLIVVLALALVDVLWLADWAFRVPDLGNVGLAEGRLLGQSTVALIVVMLASRAGGIRRL